MLFKRQFLDVDLGFRRKRRVQAARRKSSSLIATIAISVAAICAPSASAQSLGEIARREREKSKSAPPAHIYTNDDLKRPEILLPTDRARFEAEHKTPVASPVLKNAAAPADLSKPAEIPLGTVARYYRELNKLREHQENARERVLPGNNVQAAPKITTPEIGLSPRSHRLLPAAPARRDPFSRTRREPALPLPPARTRTEPVVPPSTQEATGTIRVRRGDSLWKLAARYLGNGAKWHAIAAANPGLKDPNRIRAGEDIRMPVKVSASRAAGQQRVARGDSLWKLAQNFLGSGFAWTCLAQANPQVADVNRIYPGELLNIPASCGGAPATSAAARTSD